MNSLKAIYLSILFILLSMPAFAAETVLVPDLAKVPQSEAWTVLNRKAAFDARQGSVYFNAEAETGIAWLNTTDIGEGVIEVDLKGNDVKDKSYLGIAFRGQNEKTYEAVYFRPFNFKAPDSLHRSHSVQYIAEPAYPWERLRQEHPGKYENTVTPAVNPNEFFHVKIVLENPRLRVYVNNSEEPTLAVESLATQKSGWVGFWMGKNADGTFKNLKITPIQQK